MATHSEFADLILSVDDVVVTRGGFRLGPLNIDVSTGETVCLVGPNGSGKTTLVDTVLGMVSPQSGSLSVCDVPVDRIAKNHLAKIGVVDDDPSMLFDELTAAEFWRLSANVRCRSNAQADMLVKRAVTLAEELGLDPASKKLIRDFSHGMRKKTQIAAALMHDPALLIVDELRNGLDPLAALAAERLLQGHLHAGGAILATTHDLAWASQNAERVILLAHGRPILDGSPSSICAGLGVDTLEQAYLSAVGNSTAGVGT